MDYRVETTVAIAGIVVHRQQPQAADPIDGSNSNDKTAAFADRTGQLILGISSYFALKTDNKKEH